jgi:hypothetical protein
MKRLFLCIAILPFWLILTGFNSMPSKPPPGSMVNKSHPLANGLVCAYLLNEGGGTTLNDSSMSGNKAVLYGGSWAKGGVSFNGTSDYAACTSGVHSGLTMFSVVTQLVYVPNGVNQCIMSFTAADNPSLFLDSGANNLMFYLAGSSYKIYATTYLDLYSGKPKNLVMSVPGMSRSAILDALAWVDGRLLTPTSISATSEQTARSTMIIGKGGATYLCAVMNYFYVYNRPISNAEVVWLNSNPFAMYNNRMASYNRYFNYVNTSGSGTDGRKKYPVLF